MHRFWFFFLLAASSGCSTWWSTTIVMKDGSEVEAFPLCAKGDLLTFDGDDEGVPLDGVARLRSHAGTEAILVGAAVTAIGIGTLIWWATDDEQRANDARLPVGAVVAPLGALYFSLGLIFNRTSATSPNRTCRMIH